MYALDYLHAMNDKAASKEAERNKGKVSIGKIIAYESGELNDDEIIVLFQALIDNGMAWSLQGAYGRQAEALIEAGYCSYK
jgi:hypothetical protein